MIADEILVYISKLLRSDDREMSKMGEVIFLENDPTNDDIERLNDIMGRIPILGLHTAMLINDMIKNSDKEADIL